MIKRQWTEREPFDFDGRHVRLVGAFGNPKPVQQPRPPILIAGRTARVLRVVAEHAGVWNIAGVDICEAAARSALLDHYCAGGRRDRRLVSALSAHAPTTREVQDLGRLSSRGSGTPTSTAPGIRTQLRDAATIAGVRRRFAPHQLRHAHAVEMSREGVPLVVIQRQLGHTNLGVTSVERRGSRLIA